MSKYIAIKMMKCSRYKDFLPKLNDNEQRKVMDKISILISENQEYCDKGNYGHLCNIFTAIAIYKMLLDSGSTKEQAFDVVSKEMWDYVEKGAGVYRKLHVIPILEKDFYVLAVSYDGFDETEDTIFPNMIEETEKIEEYIKKNFNGKISISDNNKLQFIGQNTFSALFFYLFTELLFAN